MTAKHPHPSGRPIRARAAPKSAMSVWRCPLDQPATPRLRPSAKVSLVDAIGYHLAPRFDDDCGAIGFVTFPERY